MPLIPAPFDVAPADTTGGDVNDSFKDIAPSAWEEDAHPSSPEANGMSTKVDAASAVRSTLSECPTRQGCDAATFTKSTPRVKSTCDAIMGMTFNYDKYSSPAYRPVIIVSTLQRIGCVDSSTVWRGQSILMEMTSSAAT